MGKKKQKILICKLLHSVIENYLLVSMETFQMNNIEKYFILQIAINYYSIKVMITK